MKVSDQDGSLEDHDLFPTSKDQSKERTTLLPRESEHSEGRMQKNHGTEAHNGLIKNGTKHTAPTVPSQYQPRTKRLCVKEGKQGPMSNFYPGGQPICHKASSQERARLC